MKKLLFGVIVIAAVAVLVTYVQAQRGGRGGGQPATGKVSADDGRVGSIPVGGSPVVPDDKVTSQPIPKLPDGHVDLTGPWVGGGSNNNMEADAGFKKGELDALLLPWARDLKNKRDIKDEPYTACLPMGVPRVNPYPWKFAMSYTS